MTPDYGRLEDELPPDDFVEAAKRADRELARKIALECRRPEVPWAHDVIGPTEAWRDYLAETDPEWSDGPDVFRTLGDGEVAA